MSEQIGCIFCSHKICTRKCLTNDKRYSSTTNKFSAKGNNKNQKQSKEISKATYSHDFSIAFVFSNGETQLFDFLPLFQKHVKGDNLKYFAPQNFKKFIVKNGNIFWGRNEDVIFPVSVFVSKSKNNIAEEKTLYII